MMSIYATSKYGIRGLSEALAAEVSHYNINVNVVVPGFISTPGLRDILPKLFPEIDYETAYQGICNQNYFRREITEQDVTNAVLFLASDEARNITSQILAVTGAVEKKAPAKEPYFTV
jgi:NAD(P)-dependent dehydrogenase (short-subunit alcohol dehydrogenase family)